MKKLNLLVSALSLTSALSIIAPVATSCSCSDQNKAITTDMLNIVGYTLKGFKSDLDLSKLEDYRTFNIPEGVKFIDENSFTSIFHTGSKGGFIQTISFPQSLKFIGKNAFQSSTSIRVLDFSSWTTEQIYYATFEENSFKDFGVCGKVIVNESLNKETKQKLYDMLQQAGLDKSWFVEDAATNIETDKQWMTQTQEVGKADFLFKFDGKLNANDKIAANVTLTNGTKGVQVDEKLSTKGYVTVESNGRISLPVSLVNHKNKGDFAQFSVTFTYMRYISGEGESMVFEPTWTQSISGFKLICGADMPDEIQITTDTEFEFVKNLWTLTSDKFTIKPNTKYVINCDFSKYQDAHFCSQSGFCFFTTLGDPYSIKKITDLFDKGSIKVWLNDTELAYSETQEQTQTWTIADIEGLSAINVNPVINKTDKVKIQLTTKDSIESFDVYSCNIGS